VSKTFYSLQKSDECKKAQQLMPVTGASILQIFKESAINKAVDGTTCHN
jgi:hypothetical protein